MTRNSLNRMSPPMEPLASFHDRYLGSIVRLLEINKGVATVQHPWKGFIRNMKLSRLMSARYEKL